MNCKNSFTGLFMSYLILFFVLLSSPLFLFSQSVEKPGELLLIPQSGHTNDVHTIQFNSDGNFFLTAATAGDVYLWNSDGQIVRSYSGNVGYIRKAAYSPDGKFVLLNGYNGINLLDGNGILLKQFSASGEIAAFSPDSKKFICNDSNRSISLYDTSGNKISELKGHTSSPFRANFSPSGQQIVSGDVNGFIFVFDLSGKVISSFKAHDKSIDFVKFTPDGNSIVSGAGDNLVQLWDLKGNLKKNLYSGSFFKSKYGFNELQFSPDGRKFVLGVSASSVYIFDLNGEEKAEIKNVLGPKTVEWSVKSGKIYIGDQSGNVYRFSGEGKYETILAKNLAPIYHLVSSAQNIVSNAKRYGLNFWDTRTETVEKIQNANYYLGKLFNSLDNKQFVAVGNQGAKVSIYDYEKRTLTREFSVVDDQSASTVSVSIDKNNKLLVSLNLYPKVSVILWDLNGKKIKDFSNLFSALTKVSLSPDGDRFIAKSSNDSSLKIYDLNGNQMKEVTEDSYYTSHVFSYSKNGKYIFSAVDKKIYVYDSDLKLKFSSPQNYRIFSAVTSSDDKLLAIAGDGRAIHLLDLNGKIVKTFNGNFGNVQSLLFSDDNKFLIAGCTDGMIRYFNVSEGKLAVTVAPTEYGILAIAPDGRFDYSDSRVMSYLAYRKGGTNEMVSLDQVFQSYYTPNLFKKVMSGTLPKPTSDINVAIKKNLPELKLEIGLPTNGKVDLNIEACDKGGGLQNIGIYQNGNLIHPDNYVNKLTQKGNCKVGILSLELITGENIFKVSAYNSVNIKAESVNVAVTYDSPASKKADLHLIMIGINEYVNAPLQFAVKDAKDLKEIFSKYANRTFEKINIYEAYNKEATKEGILATFEKAKSTAKLNDTVVIFLSGHGIVINEKFYFIPPNINDLSEEDGKNPVKSAAWEKYAAQGSISSDEITGVVTRMKSNQKMLIIDSCYSGGNWLAQISNGKSERKMEEQKSDIAKKADSSGIAMLAAAQDDQEANEDNGLAQGLLTFGLLEEIKFQKTNGKVTAFSVIANAVKRVRELARKLNHEQTPFERRTGNDFDLSN